MFLAVPLAATSQPQFPPGKLVGSVVSRANPSQRYAVYVPTSLPKDRPAPVLFILDYRGRGRVAAEIFREGAERFGWILISSNFSSSDTLPGPTIEALKAMWADAHDLLPLDPRRLYLAGLSGTARISTAIATGLNGPVAGVIGAAAGFSPEAPPVKGQTFSYFGTAGDADYNYWEMRSLHRTVSELDVPHRIEFFPGRHGWMPPSLAMEAIEWMELRAMTTGLRPVDRELVSSLWWKDLQTVETLEEAGRPTLAARLLASLVRDYKGLRSAEELDALRRRVEALAAEPWMQGAAEQEAIAAETHKRRIDAAMAVIAKAFPTFGAEPAMPLVETLHALDVPELLRLASGRDQAAAMDAARVLAELEVQTGFYLPMEAMAKQNDARAAFYLEVANAIAPRDAFSWFLRARLKARAARADEAIDRLSRAVTLGFRSLDALENQKDFDAIRGDARFHQLVEQIRAGWNQER